MNKSPSTFKSIDAWRNAFFPRRRETEELNHLRHDPARYAQHVVDQLFREFATPSEADPHSTECS